MPQYVDWFVNREKQRQGFLAMIARETPKQIMLVEAPADMGKTWLIQRLRHECRSRRIPVALFDFRDRRPWDYLTIVRQARDQLGPAHFNAMTEVINASTGMEVRVTSGSGAGGVDMQIGADGGTVTDSQVSVGDVAGRDIIKDNFFFVQADSQTARRAIEIRITDAFFACLTELTANQVVVFLFDSYEEVTAEADRWLQAQFLTRIRDGLQENLIVVLAGRHVPEFESGWQSVVARTGLTPFDVPIVQEYFLEKRGLTGLDAEKIALLAQASGGNPGLMGTLADNIAMESAPGADEDWI
jgi:hypothetical protein